MSAEAKQPIKRSASAPAKPGFWKMAHEARTDWSMLLGSLFLLIVGAGLWSLDAWWTRDARS